MSMEMLALFLLSMKQISRFKIPGTLVIITKGVSVKK